jgi:Glycosyltransferase family 87
MTSGGDEAQVVDVALRPLLRVPSSHDLRRAAARVVPAAVFFVLPVCVVLLVVQTAIGQGMFAVDFHNSFYRAGRAVLHGRFAYDLTLQQTDAFVYPPLTALLFAPLALLPHSVADGLFTVLGILCVPFALRSFGVVDRRCYGLAFLWPPVLAAIQAGNLSLLLLGGIGIAWAVRSRPAALGLTVALLVSAKLFLWPLGLWLLLSKRLRAAAWLIALFVVLNAISWVTIHAGSVTAYLGLLHRLSSGEGWDTYTLRVMLVSHLGQPTSIAIAATWLAVAAMLAAWWWRGRGDERATLAVTVLVALVASPIVWLHYLVLLLAPVALMRRSLSWIWFVPLVTLFCPGKGSGTAAQTALVLAVIAVVAVATVASGRELRRAPKVFRPA